MADNNQLNLQITAEDLASAVLRGISDGFERVNDSIKKTAAPSRTAAKNMDDVGGAANKARPQIDSMGSSLGFMTFAFNNVVQAAQTAWAALNAAIEPALKMERLNTVLKAATGSTEEAALSFQFVRDESSRLGLDLQTTASAFSRLALAAKGTSMEGEAARTMFTGFAEGFAAMRLTVDETNRVFSQITQGMNKGKLELEDLKIMAEAGIPIFKLLADAMGKSQPEIMKMISDGQLLANEVYPKLAASMHAAYGADAMQAAAGTQAELARVKNEAFLASAAFAKDLLPAAVVVFKALAGGVELLSGMTQLYKEVTSAVFAFGFALVEVDRAFASGDLFSSAGRARFADNMNQIKKTFLETVNGMGGASAAFHKSETARAEEKSRNDKRRAQEAKDALAINLAAQEKYIKTIADDETRLTAKHSAEYEDRKKIISNYFDGQFKAVEKDSGDWIRLTREKNAAIDQLEREHATTAAQIAVDVRERAIKEAAAAAAQQIALVENRLAKQELSEQAAARQILAINRAQADEELKLAQTRVSVLAVAGLKGTEEYRKGLDEQLKAQKSVNSLIVQDIRLAEQEKVSDYRDSAEAYKNRLDDELADLRQALADGTITEAQEKEKRLLAEQEYWSRIVSLRAAAAAGLDPRTQTKEYNDALAGKLTAERQYTDKSNLLKREQAAASRKALADSAAAADEWKAKADANFNDFKTELAGIGAWWAGLWNTAITTATDSLSKLSDAAYNSFAQLRDLPLRTVESVESLTIAANQAGQEFDRLSRVADQAAASQSAGWYDAWHSLSMIPAEAARITSEFLRQKAAGLELAQALEAPANATAQFVQSAQDAVGKMNLLDASSLEKLKGQIDTIKNAMLSFTEKVLGALKSLQDEWDSMTMSNLELEEKRYNEQRLQWEKDFAAAQQQGNNDAIIALQDQLALMDKIHAAKVADMKAASVAAPGMASGGKVGGSGSGDNQLRWLDPREWVIRPEATRFWGSGVMAALNAPWTDAGRTLSDRISGLAIPSAASSMPRLAMATGGAVGELPGSRTVTFNPVFNVQRLDEATVRREVIPVLEKFARLKQ